MGPVTQTRHGHSKVELKISCENLPSLLSTQVILLFKDPKTQNYELTPYKTEVIANSLNPKFVTGIIVDYYFEELQQFRYLILYFLFFIFYVLFFFLMIFVDLRLFFFRFVCINV